jgi:hypothetical protein
MGILACAIRLKESDKTIPESLDLMKEIFANLRRVEQKLDMANSILDRIANR